MAEIIELQAEPRDALGSANSRRLRAAGNLPAVLYGKKQDLLHLMVDEDAMLDALNHHARVFQLGLPGGSTSSALIKDLQINPLTDAVLHIDFQRVDLDEKIEVDAAVKVVGVPKGAADGGTLETGLGSVRLLCPVRNLPEAFRIDASGLGLTEAIEVKDLDLPAGAELITPADAMVARCNPPVVAAEAAEGDGDGEGAVS